MSASTQNLWTSFLSILSFVCLWLVASTASSINKDEDFILQPFVVEKVNSHPKAKWKADMNIRFRNTSVSSFKRLLGTLFEAQQEDIQAHTHALGIDLPRNFDAREAWPQCLSLHDILDQGHCGSCWAFGAVEALSDRFCIHNNHNVNLSENDLLSCCGFGCGHGCEGGFPLQAWQYFVDNGVVTSECDPYFDPKGCQHPDCDPLYSTPECVQECKDNANWLSVKHYASSAYRVGTNPYDIMAEVYSNGPVEVAFKVYEDFPHYNSGVYHHTMGDYLGGHAVKLIGWGTTDEGVDYWLLANSWNRQWGQDGYFMMRRGVNECGIEGNVVAGMPASPSQALSATH